jgi:Thiamine pyrophosphate-requiring enzymes [acetolactate synthase, pyruvate dehydrogenase (cytochrome), glyoxylate carboligase, phosphonopyruvate decarboxylase]
MKVVDVIAEILKREGVEFLSCYPTNPLIEAAASAGIRPIVCRQERVGVGIADGFSRVTNGRRIGVFTMQAGLELRMHFPASRLRIQTPCRCFVCRSVTRVAARRCFTSFVQRRPMRQFQNGSKKLPSPIKCRKSCGAPLPISS